MVMEIYGKQFKLKAALRTRDICWTLGGPTIAPMTTIVVLKIGYRKRITKMSKHFYSRGFETKNIRYIPTYEISL